MAPSEDQTESPEALEKDTGETATTADDVGEDTAEATEDDDQSTNADSAAEANSDEADPGGEDDDAVTNAAGDTDGDVDEDDDDDDDDEDGDGAGGDPFETMGREESRQVLYALLFASDRPMSATRLAEAISDDVDPEIVTMLLEELQEDLASQEGLPYFLKEIGGGYQLMTKATYAPYIRRLYQMKKSKRLSKAVLETLAIIAYKQPTTRAEVEAIRGVSVSHAFEQLQERRFIKVSGVADLPGRPKLYRTTEDFLVQFGMGSLKELPTLEELQEMR